MSIDEYIHDVDCHTIDSRDVLSLTSSGLRDLVDKSNHSSSMARQHPGRIHMKRKNLQQQTIAFDPIMQDEYMGISPTKDFGDTFAEKPDGYIHLAGGNINGFNVTPFNNHKGNDLHQFCKIFNVDRFFRQESNINWDLMPYLGRLPSMFQSEGALKTILAADNKHFHIKQQQWGGTFGLAFGELAIHKPEMGVDKTGFG
jgi:hypothetical protein